MKKNLRFVLMSLLVVVFTTAQAFAYSEIVNKEELKQRLGTAAGNVGDLSQVKIAILDNGFRGFESSKGMLPDSAEYIAGPLNIPSTSSHGLGMAQIVWAVSGQKPEGPKMYLVNTNGFTNFKAAIDFVIANDVDIVLYSQIWTFGSNFDGKGFINEAVNRATKQGTIWINAAGNLGAHVYNGKVKSALNKIKIQNKLDENNFTLTLTWNDFSDNELECSKKDLDLQVFDAKNNLVKSAELIQAGEAPDTKDPNDRRSCYARETLSLNELARGEYTVKVVSKSANFTDSDAYRVLVTDDRPDSLEFTDRTVGFEIMPPADNQTVITIGDKSPLSSHGPTSDGRIKPDFLVENSKVAFSNGNQTSGSSNAAAMVAGAIAVVKTRMTDLSIEKLQGYAGTLRNNYYASPGLQNIAVVPVWLQKLIPFGGVAKLHPSTGRVVVFSRTAPSQLPAIRGFNLRVTPGDIVACTETMTFCASYPQYQDSSIRPPMIEFRQYIIEQSTTPGTWITPKI